MTYLHPVAAVPNNLITDANLSYTTKRVAIVLLLLAGRKGRYVTASFAALARLCRCSTTTAQKAVKELCAQGYLLKSNRYHFDQKWVGNILSLTACTVPKVTFRQIWPGKPPASPRKIWSCSGRQF